MGDKINIINSDVDNQTSDFLDNVLKLIFSYNKKPKAHISATSKTLIDNMFFNDITKNITSEYITTSISNHLTQ